MRATDAAGNTDATPATWTWHRDTSDPTGTLNNPGANIRQTATLTSTEADPPANGYASGLQSVTYEYSADGTTWASIGTLNSAPFDTILWNTTGVTDGVYQLHASSCATSAGNTTTSAAVPNVRIDNTVPTTSQNDPGQYLRATKTLTGSAADSGSGIDHVDFQRAPTGGGSWTTIATDSTPLDGFQVSFDTTTVSDGHYDFRTVAYDVAGNQAAATPVTDRLVDNTVPTATINSPGPYLRGAVNLTSSTGDPGGSNASGVVTVAYEYSTNGGGSWQSTGANFNSSRRPRRQCRPARRGHGRGRQHDDLGAQSRASRTTRSPPRRDNAPSGWQSSPVTVTLTANDGGSGVNVTEYSVDGNPAYTVGTSVVIPAPADGSNDGAHTIAYFSADNAAQHRDDQEHDRVDRRDAADLPVLLGRRLPAWNGHAERRSRQQRVRHQVRRLRVHGRRRLDVDDDRHRQHRPRPVHGGLGYDACARRPLRPAHSDHGQRRTTSQRRTCLTRSSTTRRLTSRSCGAPTEGQLVSGHDRDRRVGFRRHLAGRLGQVLRARLALRHRHDRAVLVQLEHDHRRRRRRDDPDRRRGHGWQHRDTRRVRNVSVDNVDPTPTLADPGQYLNGTISLSASSDPDTSQVDFERRAAGGGSWVTIASDTTTPWSTSLDTTALADGLYDFRVIATDATGHTGTSPIRANVRVDNTAPTGSLTGTGKRRHRGRH